MDRTFSIVTSAKRVRIPRFPAMKLRQMTADQVSRKLWDAAAKEITPNRHVVQRLMHNGRPRWVYPDPTGNVIGHDEYTGTEVRGWPVRMLQGNERITAVIGPRKTKLHGESWVLDRLGHTLTGRDHKKMR